MLISIGTSIESLQRNNVMTLRLTKFITDIGLCNLLFKKLRMEVVDLRAHLYGLILQKVRDDLVLQKLFIRLQEINHRCARYRKAFQFFLVFLWSSAEYFEFSWNFSGALKLWFNEFTNLVEKYFFKYLWRVR